MANPEVVGTALIEILAETEKFKAQLENIGKSFGATQQKRLTNALSTPFNDGAKAASNFDKIASKALRSLSKVANETASTVAAGFKGAAAAVAGIAATAVSTGIAFNILQQKSKAALDTLLGLEKSKKLLADVNKLVDDSPFSRSNFLEGTQQLVSFGVAADNVVPILNAVQQAVAGIGGSSEDINTFAGIFAQIQSQGRITGDELLRLQEKGIDAATIIGESMGKTGAEIKDEISKGAVGADEAISALVTGINEKFGGAAAGVRSTFLGATDRVKAALRDIGGNLTAAFIDPLGGGKGVEGVNNIATALRNIQKSVIPALLPIMNALATAFQNATKAFADFTGKFVQFDDAGNKIAKVAPEITKLFDSIKDIIPILAAAGGAILGFAGPLTALVPVIGPLLAGLNPLGAAVIAFAAALPAAREGIGELFTTLAPIVQDLTPKLIGLLEALQNTIAGVASSFISQLQPVLAAFLNSLHVIIPALTLLINLAEKLKVFIAATLIFKGTVFVVNRLSAAFTALAARALAAAVATSSAAAATAKFGLALQLEKVAVGIGKVAGPLALLASVGIPLGISLFNKFKDKVVSVEEKLKILGDTALTTKTKLDKLFTEKDVKLLTLDVKGLNKDIADSESAFVEARKRALSNTRDINFNPRVLQQDFDKTEDLKNLELANTKKRHEAAELIRKAARQGQIQQTEEFIASALKEGKITLKVAEQLQRARATGLRQRDTDNKSAAAAAKAQEDFDFKSSVSINKLGEIAEAARQKLQALFSANLSLKASIKGVTDAQKAYQDTIKDGQLLQTERNTLQEQYNTLLKDTVLDLREIQTATIKEQEARLDLEDALQTEAELRQKLADLKSPASAEDLANATDEITKAEIALRNAIRARDEVQKKAIETEQEVISFAGLSIDQIKIKLADIRATQAALRNIKQPTTTKDEKSVEELQDEQILKEIDVREATEAVNKAKQARLVLDNKVISATQEIRDTEQEIERAVNKVTEANWNVVDAAKELQVITSGETTRVQTLRDLKAQIQVIDDKITSNAQAQKTAQEAIATAKSKQLQDEITLNALKQAGNDKTAEGLKLEKQRTAEILKQVGLNERFQSILKQLQVVPEGFVGPLNKGQVTQAQLTNIIPILAQRLIDDPKSVFQDIFKDLRVPGFFAEGGVVQAPGKFGMLAHVGEYNRPEMIGPLTNQSRFMSVLQQAVPHMTPGLREQLSPVLGGDTGEAEAVSISNIRMTRTNGTYDETVARRRQNDELADAIVSKLAASGVLTKGDTINDIDINVTPSSNNPQVNANVIRREIEKALKNF